MSNINVVPTAVVSPLVSSEAGTPFISASTKTHQQNSAETLFDKPNCVAPGCQLMCSNRSDCQDSVKNSKVSFVLEKNSKYANLSDCTVELTNFQHNSYSNHLTVGTQQRLPVTNTNKQKNKTSSNSKILIKEKRVLLRKQNPRKRNKLLCHITNATPAKRQRKAAENIVQPSFEADSIKTRSKKKEEGTSANEKFTPAANNSTAICPSTMYTPKKSDILQRFSSNVTVCSLCHLPANFLPRLGDLFGPYRPSYCEVLEQYKEVHKQFSTAEQARTKSATVKSEKQLFVDQQRKICYVKSPGLSEQSSSQRNEAPSSLSISGSAKNIHSLMPELNLFQTIDCIISEADKKPVAKFCRNSKSLRIPGFSGKVTSTDKSLLVYSDANKSLLHDVNTVVIMEPTKDITHDEKTLQSSSSCAASAAFTNTSIDVMHRFDISPIWLHAPCAVWTPGIYCVRNKVYGVTTAVRAAADSICTYCKRSGATISCKFKKNEIYHYLCCFANSLSLDEATLMAVS